MTTQAAIEALLKQKIGMDAGSVGTHPISRAIQQRMTDCGLPNLSLYWERLQTVSQELEALIEAVVVPETWFFRDRKPFSFLSQWVVSEWLPQHLNGVLRVLSVPCATGEEPYSIAIALLEAGLSPHKFRVEAIDISQMALLKARKACYGAYSFRNTDLAFQERYFTKVGEEYQLQSFIKNQVHFSQNNLLSADFLSGKKTL